MCGVKIGYDEYAENFKIVCQCNFDDGGCILSENEQWNTCIVNTSPFQHHVEESMALGVTN